VKVSDAEKRLFACWIDLSIPFGGSYAEATTWSPEDRKIAEYHQDKRAIFACQELNTLRAQLNLRPVSLGLLQSGMFAPVPRLDLTSQLPPNRSASP
jgi:hypothetical protein